MCPAPRRHCAFVLRLKAVKIVPYRFNGTRALAGSRGVEAQNEKGLMPATMTTPWVDVRLTVRRMRRVNWTVDRTGGQVAEDIVCFGMTAPKGRGWF